MQSIQKIAILTDFSKDADSALEVAAYLSKKFNGTLFLLHVIPPTRQMTQMYNREQAELNIEEEYSEHLKKAAEKKLNHLLQSPSYSDINIEWRILNGNFFKVIHQAISDLKIDLIVMGTKGSSNADGLLIGSNTEKIVRYSQIPVLVLQDVHTLTNIKQIVAATTLQNDQYHFISQLSVWQECFGAHLHLLSVQTAHRKFDARQFESQKELITKTLGLKNHTFHHYSSTTELDGINHFAAEIQADLIAIGTNQRKGIARLLWGSITQELIQVNHTPILAFSLS
jgi:nucleotide-binding universal stress UspA family protein